MGRRDHDIGNFSRPFNKPEKSLRQLRCLAFAEAPQREDNQSGCDLVVGHPPRSQRVYSEASLSLRAGMK